MGNYDDNPLAKEALSLLSFGPLYSGSYRETFGNYPRRVGVDKSESLTEETHRSIDDENYLIVPILSL